MNRLLFLAVLGVAAISANAASMSFTLEAPWSADHDRFPAR
jgi:hypothetical protein